MRRKLGYAGLMGVIVAGWTTANPTIYRVTLSFNTFFPQFTYNKMKLYCEIGPVISSRPEKGAAVAAAEYLCSTYPDASGFSPRNLRRMRELYRTYENSPEVMVKACAAKKISARAHLEISLDLNCTVCYYVWQKKKVTCSSLR